MTYIAILMALVANRVLSRFENHREPKWFLAWVRGIEALLRKLHLNAAWFVVVVAVFFPAVIIYGVSWLLTDQSWSSIPWLLFSILVLWMSLGPKDLYGQLSSYLQALKHHDKHRAKQLAQDILECNDSELTERMQAAEQTRMSQYIIQAIENRIYTAANDRYFAVIFWFVVLSAVGAGPAGAILYRGTEYLATHPSISNTIIRRPAKIWHDLLAWLPAHLLALIYPLLGDFHLALKGWQDYLENPSQPYGKKHAVISSHRVLLAVGVSSQQTDDDSRQDNSFNHPPSNHGHGIRQIENAIRITSYSLIFCLGLYALVIAAGKFW